MGLGSGGLGAETSNNGRIIGGVCVWQLAQDLALTKFVVLVLVVSGILVADNRPCKGGAVRGSHCSDARHAFESVEQECALRKVGHCNMVSCSTQGKNAVLWHLPDVISVAQGLLLMVGWAGGCPTLLDVCMGLWSGDM